MTCDTSAVTPPGSAIWYDLEATTADVLAILRLTDADVDATRIGTLIPVAARFIDIDLDRPEAVLGPPPAPELHAGVGSTHRRPVPVQGAQSGRYFRVAATVRRLDTPVDPRPQTALGDRVTPDHVGPRRPP